MNAIWDAYEVARTIWVYLWKSEFDSADIVKYEGSFLKSWLFVFVPTYNGTNANQ
jgi:hypothetical protein